MWNGQLTICHQHQRVNDRCDQWSHPSKGELEMTENSKQLLQSIQTGLMANSEIIATVTQQEIDNNKIIALAQQGKGRNRLLRDDAEINALVCLYDRVALVNRDIQKLLEKWGDNHSKTKQEKLDGGLP